MVTPVCAGETPGLRNRRTLTYTNTATLITLNTYSHGPTDYFPNRRAHKPLSATWIHPSPTGPSPDREENLQGRGWGRDGRGSKQIRRLGEAPSGHVRLKTSFKVPVGQGVSVESCGVERVGVEGSCAVRRV